MDKVLVTVIVPSIEKKYDILVPANKRIKTLISLLNKSINELSDFNLPIKKNMILLSEKGQKYDLNQNIKEAGIKNGTKLILL